LCTTDKKALTACRENDFGNNFGMQKKKEIETCLKQKKVAKQKKQLIR
jgi:hypothetical protein